METIFRKNELLKIIDKFHKPLDKMNEEKAAIIIQKHWRRYRTRKRYLIAMNRLK